MTRVLDLTDKSTYFAYINEAAQALRDGKIIAFPTETVYGLGANAGDKRAVSCLYEIKQRPIEKRFTILIPSDTDVMCYVEQVTPGAKKLMDRFWPGPLTIVMPGRNGESIGLRMPGHKAISDLLSISEIPIAAPSANISGQPPATTAKEVFEVFAGKIEIILDDGTKPHGIPSTVVRVNEGGGIEILRYGSISAEDVYSCLMTGTGCKSSVLGD